MPPPQADHQPDADRARLPWWVSGADWLVVLLMAFAAAVLVIGPVRVHVGWLRITATSPSRLAADALVLAALRHLARRRPTIFDHTRRLAAVAVAWPRAARTAAATALVTRLAVLLVGLFAVFAIGYSADDQSHWRVSPDELANLPARFDSGWYVSIAEHGYQWGPTGPQNVAFFPAYPILTRVAADVIWWGGASSAEILWAGVLVSVVAFGFALAYLYALARDQIGEDGAPAALALIAAYPFAVFFGAAYTESLFLLSAVATFHHFSRGDLWRAAAWGLLAGFTRPNAWMISASLALIALPAIGGPFGALARLLPRADRERRTGLGGRPFVALAFAVAAPVASVLMYCAYMFWLTGDPLAWGHVMTYWNRDFHGLSMLHVDFRRMAANGFLFYVTQHPIEGLNALALLFAVATIWPVTRRLGFAYGLFVLVNIALPALSGGLVSIGRYSSVLFPSFIWLAAVTPRSARPAAIASLAIGQGLAAALFFSWRWIY